MKKILLLSVLLIVAGTVALAQETNAFKKNKRALYVKDGEIVSLKEVSAMDPNDISEIEVLRGASAVERFGKAAKRGAVVITTKAFRQGLAFSNSSVITTKPLFIVDEKAVKEEDLKTIHVDDIESVEVLKDSKAVERYGESGVNGVVIIRTKKKSE
ncbi:MAG: TonB-dependent receptor plug domain-containing protein [Bacteroidia bacterium]|nr:TonB-dependent receptor plug domain-containing protein [Bacteroidia bacterium]